MRLIDADAEIARIRQEIERIEAKINRLEKKIEEEPFNTIHDFTEELERCYRNKIDCQAEISTLTNYMTAYDVDKVVERLEDLKRRYWFAIANTGDEKLDCAYEKVGDALDRTIEIVKSGGIGGKERNRGVKILRCENVEISV